MTTAIIRIDRLALHGHHGVHEAERALGQRFFLDLRITADIGDACASDDIDETVHYGHVIRVASETFTSEPFNLIEAAAAAVADELLTRFQRIQVVKATVHKPSAPVTALIEDVSVTIVRERQ